MIRNRQGFTLIEVLIATAIASILMGSLFFAYGQMSKTFYFTRNYIDLYDSAILIQQQLQKDIAGAFIPAQAVTPKKEQKKPGQTAQPAQKDEPLKKDEKGAKDEKTKVAQSDDTPKKKIVKDPFLSKNAQKQMQMLTFITNNPMRVYVSAKSGQYKPAIVRVVYTLEKDPASSKDKPLFILYRQESIELQLAPYLKSETAIERYPLVHNVVSCKLAFEALDSKEDGATEIVKFSDWRIGDDSEDVRSKVKLPTMVNVTLVLTDDNHNQEKEFTFACVVMAGYHTLPEVQEAKGAAPPSQPKGATPNTQPSEGKKELLVSSANNIVNNIRELFGA